MLFVSWEIPKVKNCERRLAENAPRGQHIFRPANNTFFHAVNWFYRLQMVYENEL